jgi:hypothetical protein
VSQNNNPLPKTLSVSAAGRIFEIIQHGTSAVGPYDDVPQNNGFADFVSVLKSNAITSGCSTTTFCPDTAVSRAQMAVFIIRAMMGGDNFTFPSSPYFSDVPSGHPFFRWIQKMRELGITTGCGASIYCPDGPVTRGQVAVFLIRSRFGESFSFSQTPYFADVGSGNGFFPYIQKMRETGITAGCNTSTYCPDDTNTRAQMAVFITRGFFTPW